MITVDENVFSVAWNTGCAGILAYTKIKLFLNFTFPLHCRLFFWWNILPALRTFKQAMASAFESIVEEVLVNFLVIV